MATEISDSDLVNQCLNWTVAHFWDEVAAVRGAPTFFAVSVAVVAVILYLFFRWRDADKLEARDEVIRLVTATRDDLKLRWETAKEEIEKLQIPRNDPEAARQIEALKERTALKVKVQETFLSWRPPESEAKPYYKAKLGIGFVNLSDRAIHLLAPTWQSQSGDVGVQAPFWSRYQRPIDGRWKESWKTESIDVTVEPNGQFRIMVGLDKACPHSELENRRRSGTLGALLIPIEIGSFRSAFKYRVRDGETDLTPITETV
jgi:hypothetical protein